MSEASFSHAFEVARGLDATLPRRAVAKLVLVSSFIFAGQSVMVLVEEQHLREARLGGRHDLNPLEVEASAVVCDFSQGTVGRAVSHPDEVEVFGIAPRSRAIEFVEASAANERQMVEAVRFGGAVQHRFKQQILFDLDNAPPRVCQPPLMDRI